MKDVLNAIHHGDCIKAMDQLPKGSVDLAFADPPFNIGYDYDVYEDSVEYRAYVKWSRDWIKAVRRVLKPNGTFWLAIGDEYAAELKLESQKVGFHCRSWVIWYYTFGVNCSKKFTRSHAHLFYFVKDPDEFTFRDEDLDNRVPSARQLVYNDKRANPKGRLPDDTWIIRPAEVVAELVDGEGTWSPAELPPPSDNDRTFTLRPQDLDQRFQPSEDTWYFPRVAGTFKERAGFHGCQMPEQLLARIIRTCSNEGDVVLDPFSGSATTLAVAKKLARQYVGFEISDDYVSFGTGRLASVRVGDRLDGSPEPNMGGKKTPEAGGKRPKRRSHAENEHPAEPGSVEERYQQAQLELTLRGVADAFRESHSGFSADRLVADPDLNLAFVENCKRFGLAGDARTWNTLLFRLRKAGKLATIETNRQTKISWNDCDDYLFASEIALQILLDEPVAQSMDEILCDPLLAEQFDKTASRFAPGYSPLQYRWAALKLRKQAKTARNRSSVLKPPSRLGEKIPVKDLIARKLSDAAGVYVVGEHGSSKLYVGEASNLRHRLGLTFAKPQKKAWKGFGKSLVVQTLRADISTAGRLAWQSCLVKKYKQRPRLNYAELRST